MAAAWVVAAWVVAAWVVAAWAVAAWAAAAWAAVELREACCLYLRQGWGVYGAWGRGMRQLCAFCCRDPKRLPARFFLKAYGTPLAFLWQHNMHFLQGKIPFWLRTLV